MDHGSVPRHIAHRQIRSGRRIIPVYLVCVFHSRILSRHPSGKFPGRAVKGSDRCCSQSVIVIFSGAGQGIRKTPQISMDVLFLGLDHRLHRIGICRGRRLEHDGAVLIGVIHRIIKLHIRVRLPYGIIGNWIFWIYSRQRGDIFRTRLTIHFAPALKHVSVPAYTGKQGIYAVSGRSGQGLRLRCTSVDYKSNGGIDTGVFIGNYHILPRHSPGYFSKICPFCFHRS